MSKCSIKPKELIIENSDKILKSKQIISMFNEYNDPPLKISTICN